MPNINGGDTRLDQEYPSCAWVAPLGKQVGNYRQICASNSNENAYTDMWADRYFDFKDLVRTRNSTGKPGRIKPFNFYFRMCSGERLPSLTELRMNLDYARTAEMIPITTSNYCAIAEGFYSTRIVRLDKGTGPSRIAVLLSFAVTLFVTVHYVRQLPYQAFVCTDTSAR